MLDTKKILSYVRRACDQYEMIEDGDVIAVGVSGGKDSLALLVALYEMRRFYPKHYDLFALTVDMGLPDMDFSGVAELCRRLGIPYYTEKTEISNIIFNIRKEANPCALCAKMRRGVLHQTAKRLGATKVAFGHHFDDVVETFMLNLFFEGRIGCFQPKTYLSRTDITLIRPFVLLPEKEIRSFVKKAGLPVVETTCPADKNSERLRMKELLRRLEQENHGLRNRVFGAIRRGHVDGF
ncbi:MAG: ATP-binding protein [Eubacteriales bacterium]|nr:ATP-binding protein [Eubacteriales bacterium]